MPFEIDFETTLEEVCGARVDDLGARVLVLAVAREGDRQHVASRARLHQPDRRVLHGQLAAQVAVDPFHRGVAYRPWRAWSRGCRRCATSSGSWCSEPARLP